MKKQLIAAAVLSTFAGVAAAQSSVTLFGVADVGITNYRTAQGADSITAMASGNQAGSRWGLRGTEDLGNGLRANFWLESGFSLDTGNSAQSGRLFGRQAWVGVAGGFGEVRLGRQTLQSSIYLGGVDAFAAGWGMASMAGSVLAATTMRADNTIGYISPAVGGFQAALQYSLQNNGAEAANNNNTHTTLAARYSQGPIVAVFTYDTVDGGPAGIRDQDMWTLGASYNFGVARVMATYTNEEDVLGATSTSNFGAYAGPSSAFGAGPLGSADSRSWTLGVVVPLDALSLHAQFQDRNDKTVANNDFRIWAVGATYTLSPRTNLYTTYADRSANGSATVAGDRREQREFTVGVRHSF